MKTYITNCPRCRDKTYETFSSHTICHSCNYTREFDVSLKKSHNVPKWAIDAFKNSLKKENLKNNEVSINNEKEAS